MDSIFTILLLNDSRQATLQVEFINVLTKTGHPLPSLNLETFIILSMLSLNFDHKVIYNFINSFEFIYKFTIFNFPLFSWFEFITVELPSLTSALCSGFPEAFGHATLQCSFRLLETKSSCFRRSCKRDIGRHELNLYWDIELDLRVKF